MSNKKTNFVISRIVMYVILIVFLVFFLFPIIWLAITSVKPQAETMSPTLPSRLTMASYVETFTRYSFAKYFPNSVIVSVLSTLLVAIVAVPGAYGFAKYKYKGCRTLFMGCVLLRMVPFIALMVPLYIYLSNLGLINTKTALVIANMTFNLPLSLWIMESYFREFPNELIEAASIDGSGRIGTLIKIVAPISLPSISTVVILTFLTTWKEFLFAFISSASDESKTITVGIAALTQDYGIRWDLMSAAGTVCILPVLIIAICFQKYIIAGMTVGAVKG